MSGEATVCERCGAWGSLDHEWVEGDCVLPHRYDKKTHPPQAKVGWCCHGCIQRHINTLTQVVDMYAMLGDVLLAGSIPDDTAEHSHVKKQPASPSPLRLEAWAMLLDTDRLHAGGTRNPDGTFTGGEPADLPDPAAVLQAWANNARGTFDVPFTVAGAANALTAHAETIAASPWVDEYDAELRWLHRHLKAASGTFDIAALGDCITVTDGRDCYGQVWPAPDGDKPKCDRCGRRYGTLDLVRLKRMQEAS
jgi:hypothetical protein